MGAGEASHGGGRAPLPRRRSDDSRSPESAVAPSRLGPLARRRPRQLVRERSGTGHGCGVGARAPHARVGPEGLIRPGGAFAPPPRAGGVLLEIPTAGDSPRTGARSLKTLSRRGAVQLTLFDPATNERTALATEPELPADQTVALVQPRCANGVHDAGDGLIDYPSDPGCANPSSDTENPSCQDGLDNDGDGKIDFDGGASANHGVPLGAPDPGCWVPFRDTEATFSCGLGVELAAALPLLMAPRRRVRRRP
jgi:hypothetical protein